MPGDSGTLSIVGKGRSGVAGRAMVSHQVILPLLMGLVEDFFHLGLFICPHAAQPWTNQATPAQRGQLGSPPHQMDRN